MDTSVFGQVVETESRKRRDVKNNQEATPGSSAEKQPLLMMALLFLRIGIMGFGGAALLGLLRLLFSLP